MYFHSVETGTKVGDEEWSALSKEEQSVYSKRAKEALEKVLAKHFLCFSQDLKPIGVQYNKEKTQFIRGLSAERADLYTELVVCKSSFEYVNLTLTWHYHGQKFARPPKLVIPATPKARQLSHEHVSASDYESDEDGLFFLQ